MEVKFVEPNIELISAIAMDMRQADVEEIWSASHHSPIESLMKGWGVSDFSAVVTVNDEPCVMLGLLVRDALSGYGVPWLLGTEGALKYKRQFLKQSPPIIAEMLNICPTLYNYVHVKNKVSIKWLKWMGFTIEEPLPHGRENELFHKFHLERV